MLIGDTVGVNASVEYVRCKHRGCWLDCREKIRTGLLCAKILLKVNRDIEAEQVLIKLVIGSSFVVQNTTALYVLMI